MYLKKVLQGLGLRGFTLIELLIVLLVLGILTAIAIPMFQGMALKARAARILTNVNAIERYIDMWITEYGWEDEEHMAATVASMHELIVSLERSYPGESYSIAWSAGPYPPPVIWLIRTMDAVNPYHIMFCQRRITRDRRYWRIDEATCKGVIGRVLKDLLLSLGEEVEVY